MAHVLQLFILRLRLLSTAEGRSFSRPNIRLRPEVKIVPTVQHCHRHLDNMLPIYSILSLPKQVSSLVPGFHNWYCFLIEQSNEQISQVVFLILYTFTEINTYVVQNGLFTKPSNIFKLWLSSGAPPARRVPPSQIRPLQWRRSAASFYNSKSR